MKCVFQGDNKISEVLKIMSVYMEDLSKCRGQAVVFVT